MCSLASTAMKLSESFRAIVSANTLNSPAASLRVVVHLAISGLGLASSKAAVKMDYIVSIARKTAADDTPFPFLLFSSQEQVAARLELTRCSFIAAFFLLMLRQWAIKAHWVVIRE